MASLKHYGLTPISPWQLMDTFTIWYQPTLSLLCTQVDWLSVHPGGGGWDELKVTSVSSWNYETTIYMKLSWHFSGKPYKDDCGNLQGLGIDDRLLSYLHRYATKSSLLSHLRSINYGHNEINTILGLLWPWNTAPISFLKTEDKVIGDNSNLTQSEKLAYFLPINV